jgi:glyoxylase-like metal-dependent hydrolase (beta-lactamase superfamily II)
MTRWLAARRVAALSVCTLSWAAAAEYPPVHATLVPQRVSQHAWFVQGGSGVASAANEGFNSNAGFVVTDEGVVVVDALGTPSLGAALLQAIHGVTRQPVKRVILTHYHADHFYGLAPLKAAGAEVWAHEAARAYLASGEPEKRRAQRAEDLFPWVAPDMPIVAADRWLGEHTAFTLGGVRFEVDHMGPAHSPEDLIVVLPGEGVIFAGDILFAGRIPFVGEADSKAWIAKIDELLALHPKVMVTGHGAVSRDPARDLALTRDYLAYLRETMGRAAEDLTPFDEAYAKTDWSRFSALPAFEAANRINAYGTYLLMERELLKR